MSTEERLSETPRSKPRLLLRQGYSVVGGVTHGVSSVAKTSLLRRDRVSDAFYRTRLSICQDCPGGHAKFHKNGSLSTCGPMLKSLRGEGQQTCGCVLSQKARDVKESCPFGYWPTLNGSAIQDKLQGAENPIVVPSLASNFLTRRHFMGATLGALASAVVVRPSWASEADGCYVNLTACGSGGQSGAYTDCSAVEGWEIGKVYEGSDGECYTLSSDPPTNQAGTNQVTLVAGAKEDCQECEEDNNPDPGNPLCNIAGNQFYENSRVFITFAGSVVQVGAGLTHLHTDKSVEWINSQMGTTYSIPLCSCNTDSATFLTSRFHFEESPNPPHERVSWDGSIYAVYTNSGWEVGLRGPYWYLYGDDYPETPDPGESGDCTIVGQEVALAGGYQITGFGGADAASGFAGPLLDGFGIEDSLLGSPVTYDVSVSASMQTQHID